MVALFGVIISGGVIIFMLLFGLIFTTILQVSLTKVIGVISPIAFGILIIISSLLILDIDVGRLLPTIQTPITHNPLVSSFTYGFFFGAIVIPCNPLFIAALFARTLSTISFFGNILSFLSFGFGMAFPLLVFSMISTASSKKMISYLTKYRRVVNLLAGMIMLIVSAYYLIFVFRVFG